MASREEWVECAYCGREVNVNCDVPDADDADAWEELADHHAEDCEWIRTRAHRRNRPEVLGGIPTASDYPE